MIGAGTSSAVVYGRILNWRCVKNGLTGGFSVQQRSPTGGRVMVGLPDNAIDEVVAVAAEHGGVAAIAEAAGMDRIVAGAAIERHLVAMVRSARREGDEVVAVAAEHGGGNVVQAGGGEKQPVVAVAEIEHLEAAAIGVGGQGAA